MDRGNPHLPATSASNDNYRDSEPQENEDSLQKPSVSGRALEHASSSQEMLRSMKLPGPLGSYHRGTALRMVTDYLSDLTTLSRSFDENVQRRVEENRSFLTELTEANQREPNSPLTWQERSKLTEMLKDYQHALSAALEDQDDDDGDMPDVDNDVEFKAEEDVAGGVSLHLYGLAKCSSSDIMERLTSALDLCETQVREFKDQLGVVRVYRHQCRNLVETLEPTAESNFERCHRVMDALKRAKVDGVGVSTSDRYSLSVQICFESLIALARKFQLVLELLRRCASENLHRTALELADLPPPPSMSRRWSEFSFTIRNCEWSMDFVEFAFITLEKLLAGSTNIFQDVSYRWCEERNRMVLQTQGKLGRQDSRLEKSVLDVSKELEAKDLDELKMELRVLGESASGSIKWKLSGILSRAAYDRAYVAKFLSEKLSGPIPHARYLPWTFRVDPSTLKFREYLDSGGAGMVAKYSWFGENVAVKSVRSPGLTRNKFEEEAAILATVQHPNVVRLVGCGFIEKNMTGQLVMELMEHDLRTVIEKRVGVRGPGARPFAPSVAIDIIQQIAQAMKHLKDHKILHRDLKAKNILVNIIKPPTMSGGCLGVSNVLPYWHKDETYVAKLADFGLAKCRPHSSWVRTRMAGTTGWRAPEVFHVQDTEVTQDYKWPADVYSFGMTCYEILTGNLPFANLPNQLIHENVMAGKRPDELDELEVPELLKVLVKKCWATKPEDRPTFDDIVKSLWECRVQAVVPVLVRHIGVPRSPSVVERHDSSSTISRSASNF